MRRILYMVCAPLVFSHALAQVPDWTAAGPQADAWLGYSLAGVGDVNGDGFDDVLAGAPYYDNGEANEGGLFLYFGGAAGLSTAPDWTAEGNQAGAFLGWSVAGAGDVNHDGYADVIAGAIHYTDGQKQEGRVMVWYGSAAGLGPSADWSAQIDQPYAWLGYSVAGAGDVNGDGFDDVLAGAFQYANGQQGEGGAWVWYGSAGGLGANGTPANAGWTAEGQVPYAGFGGSVAGAGDVNRDGYADLFIGALRYTNGEEQEGAALLFYGSATGPAAVPDWTAEADQAGAHFGSSVAGIGDVNKDGYADVAVGAPSYANGQVHEGGVFVWYGSAAGLGANGTPANADWAIEGEQAGARLGGRVAAAGDFTADAVDDLLVGASHQDGAVPDAGAAWVYAGSTTGLSAGAAWTVTAPQTAQHLGFQVAGAGDVNQDDGMDLLIAGYGYDTAVADAGQAQAHHGTPILKLLVEPSVWLAGGYDTGALTTALNAAGQLPTAQPYDAAPWAYLGPEQVFAVPHADVVDWVLAELRTGTAAATRVARAVGFVLADGRVVDLDGVGPLAFPAVAAGAYHLVLQHRTHLGVMSAGPVALSTTPTAYTFTTAQAQAFGTNPMVEIEPGAFALWSGDGNADGTVTAFDFLQVWLPQNGGPPGYHAGDFNLSAQVTAFDFILGWLPSSGQATQVP